MQVYLKEQGLSPCCEDKWKRTPLHWACHLSADNAVCYLCAWVKDLETKDCEGYTPLHLAVAGAITNGDLQPMKMMLVHGASREAVVRDFWG